jgi:hypothetical protein
MQHSLSPITADSEAVMGGILTRPVPDTLVNIAHIGKVKRRRMGREAEQGKNGPPAYVTRGSG